MRKFINFLIKREQSRTGSGFAECEKSRLKAKLTMTLALLIMAVGGAWAQSAFGVVEFEVPEDWKTDNTPLTAADLPGFKEVTLDKAQTWTGAPATGRAMLVYAFDGNTINFVNYDNGNGGGATTSNTKQQVFALKSLYTFYYTTEITEWDLTSQDGKNWILDKMPANNIELQVEYYTESNLFLSKEALADKANIAVTAGDLGVQFGEDGKSANPVAEGTAMTVKYNGAKKVLGVKVEKKVEAKTLAEATSEDIGKIVGADGKIYATKADAEAVATGNAVAKIIYIGTTGHATYSHGLALALTDEGQMTWEAAKTACNTTKNTSTPVTGATWLLASKDQWDYMLGTNGAGSYTALRDGFTSVGGSNLQSGEYWSSTEVDYNGNDLVDSDYARYYYFNYGGIWSYVGKGSGYRVRACLAF